MVSWGLTSKSNMQFESMVPSFSFTSTLTNVILWSNYYYQLNYLTQQAEILTIKFNNYNGLRIL